MSALRQRILIARLYLRLGRRYRETYFAHLGPLMGRQNLRVALRMFVAKAEGRPPYTASTLSRKLGMARPTVLRHLDRLIKTGYAHRVGARYELTDTGLVHPASNLLLQANRADILATAKELSKMDTST